MIKAAIQSKESQIAPKLEHPTVKNKYEQIKKTENYVSI